MKRCWLLLTGLSLLEAGVIPNRYIVELSDEPVAAEVLRTAPVGARRVLESTAASRYRDRVRAAQRVARARVEQLGATVIGSVDTVADALLVQIPDAQAAGLSRVPGVLRV